MTQTKAARAAESLNGVAAKVLAAMPMSEPLTVAQVCTALHRVGSRIDQPIVMGCMRALVDSGHCKEGPPQYFRRITVASQDEPEPKAKPAPAPANVVPMPMPERMTERDPLETIGALAARLRESGRQLLMFAEDLERLGIEYETRIESAGQDGAKLRQLQTLLKSLS